MLMYTVINYEIPHVQLTYPKAEQQDVITLLKIIRDYILVKSS